jgi:antitoxin ParD1/3/4
VSGDREPPESFTAEENERIRAHVRARGMTFEVFLPETLADWLREKISAGVYKDPAEAAWVAFQALEELDRHPEVRRQLLALVLDDGLSAPGETMTIEQWRARHLAKLTEWARTEPPEPRPIPRAPACDED